MDNFACNEIHVSSITGSLGYIKVQGHEFLRNTRKPIQHENVYIHSICKFMLPVTC